MDGGGYYYWNDTSNIYIGQWLKRNRHGHGVYVIVYKCQKSMDIDKGKEPNTAFKFTCGNWKDDHLLMQGQIKYKEAW